MTKNEMPNEITVYTVDIGDGGTLRMLTPPTECEYVSTRYIRADSQPADVQGALDVLEKALESPKNDDGTLWINGGLDTLESVVAKAVRLLNGETMIEKGIEISLTAQQQPVNAVLDLDNAREVFENWLTGNGNYPHLKHKSFGGQYLSEEAAMKWDGFKAGYYAITRAEQKGGV